MLPHLVFSYILHKIFTSPNFLHFIICTIKIFTPEWHIINTLNIYNSTFVIKLSLYIQCIF